MIGWLPHRNRKKRALRWKRTIQPGVSPLTPEAMSLLFNPVVYRATLRQLAETAYKQLTGQTKKPGLRALRNAWLSVEEYKEINVRRQIDRLKGYALTGDSEIELLLKTYSKEAELGVAIKNYLEEMTYNYDPVKYLPKNFLDRVKIIRTDQRGYTVAPRTDNDVREGDRA